jgi:hypothetical protein
LLAALSHGGVLDLDIEFPPVGRTVTIVSADCLAEDALDPAVIVVNEIGKRKPTKGKVRVAVQLFCRGDRPRKAAIRSGQ